jgi:excinuclease UvrABC ATPase subunit
MKKIGRNRIQKKGRNGNPATCTNCGKEGEYRVTFEHKWGEVIVTLCEECAAKRYEELNLQLTLDWPVIV